MSTRKPSPSDDSFFLLGTRGTGKTTWIHEHFRSAIHYDLLLSSESLRLSRDPSRFRAECLAQPDGSWIVVDEVQHLMTVKRQRFVLSGSSACFAARSH